MAKNKDKNYRGVIQIQLHYLLKAVDVKDAQRQLCDAPLPPHYVTDSFEIIKVEQTD
jgi:hypothetical protein